MNTRAVAALTLLLGLLVRSAWAVGPGEPRVLRVACLGDSITAGANVEAGDRYPARLQALLGSGYEVRNFGLGSATLLRAGSPNVWQRLDEVLAYEPDIVTIALGTNDTVSGRRANWERIDRFEADYAALIGRLAAMPTKPRILVCTPTDMVLETPGLSEDRAADLALRRPRLLDLCERIRGLAAARTAQGVELVELHGLLTGRPALVAPGDGVHPVASGYALIAAALAGAIERRPNIILFLVDDLGWQDASVPLWERATPLNERYRTPNLEKLAARGMKFTNAYASAPVCTPTRTSIMTGMCPARTHITYWTLNKDTDTSRPRDDIAAPAWAVNGLQPGDYETLPEVLHGAGYRAIHVGKAHFGTHGTPGGDPAGLGFDVNIAGHASGGPASYYGLQHFTVAGREGKPPHSSPSVWDIPGLEKYHGHDIYLTEALAIEACQAIRDSVEAGEPFYMNFAPYAVHAPIMGNKKYEPNYPDLDERERAYASMIETYDAALGAIVTTLEETGQLDNTVIIFSSDNGGLSAHARGAAPDGQTTHTHNAPLKSGKGSAYEGGTRVPTIIAWPGVTDTPSTCDVPIVSHDFYPTVIALAGLRADRPGGAGVAAIDGRDLTPLLTGRTERFDARRVLGWNQPHQWGASGPGIWPFTSIRVGDWKLIYFHAGRRFELYDLGADIGETRDLAGEMPGMVAELARVMDAWIDDTGAQLSIDKQTGREIERPGAAAARLVGGLPVSCVPVPSPETRSQAAGWGDRSWMDQFEDIRRGVSELRPRVVLIGDSITQGFAGAGRQVGGAGADARAAHLDPLGPVLNAGISGDRTQHVLWRLDHGMLDGCEPGVIVLMIGTNNLPDDNAESIVQGIDAVVQALELRSPRSRVLLVSVPPRGREPDDPLRVRGEIVNREIAELADGRRVLWLDITPLLTDGEGRARTDRMAGDFVHFSGAGYDAVARAIAGVIGEVPRP